MAGVEGAALATGILSASVGVDWSQPRQITNKATAISVLQAVDCDRSAFMRSSPGHRAIHWQAGQMSGPVRGNR